MEDGQIDKDESKNRWIEICRKIEYEKIGNNEQQFPFTYMVNNCNDAGK